VVIQRTSTQERLLAPAAAAEERSGEDVRDSWEDLEIPVLRSSLEEPRIVDVAYRLTHCIRVYRKLMHT
jgi:hypothetical protein